MHERTRSRLEPFQPAVKRRALGAAFPVATARPAPTPTVVRRLGGVAYGYGEKERKVAGAGEKFYFVRTEPFTRRQQSSDSAAGTPTQVSGSAASGTNVSDGGESSGTGTGASGRGSVGASRTGTGPPGSVTNSVSASSSPDNDVSSSSSVSSSSGVSSSDDVSASSDTSPSSVVTSSSQDISSISSSDPISSFSETFSSFSSLLGPNSTLPSITPDVSSLPPSVTPPPNDTSSGISTTIFSTVILTNSDGSESTSVIAIPTVLPYPSSAPSSTNKRTIIIGASIGGVALLIIVASLLIFLKRSEKVRLNYKKLRVFGRRRQNLLDDEDDDWLENDHDGPGSGSGFRGHGLSGGSIGTPYSYADYRPVSAASSTRFRGVGGLGGGGSTREGNISGHTTPFDVEGMLAESPVKPAPSPSPYLLGMRATGSGSIFQEQGVWPPPSEKSRLVDPLVAGSEQVELGNIVDRVMGEPQQNPQVPAHGRQPSAAQSSSRYAHSTMSSYGSGISQYPPTRDQSLATRNINNINTTSNANASGPSVQTAPMPSPALREQWEAARAQSPDSLLYDLSGSGGTLAVVNADPTTPTEGPPVPLLPPPQSSSTSVTKGAGGVDEQGESAGQGTNWLERHPRESLEFHAL